MAVNTNSPHFARSANSKFYLYQGNPTLMPTIRNMSKFTWEAWVKPDPENNDNYFWHESMLKGRTSTRFGVQTIKGKLRFQLAVKDGDIATNYTYPIQWDDFWHHIAFTADTDRQQYQIFVDGGLVQSGTLVGGGRDNEDKVIPITDERAFAVDLGYHPTKGTWFGKFDCVRLWDTQRSETQIAETMNDFVNATSVPNLFAQFDFTAVAPVTATRSSSFEGTVSLLGHNLSTGAATLIPVTTDRPFMGDGVNDSTPPSAPTVNAPTNITATSFTISFNESTDNVYVQYYEVDVSTDNTFTSYIDGWSARNVALGRVHTIDAIPNSVYYVRVRAVDAKSNASAWGTYANNAPIITPVTNDYSAPSIPPQSLRVVSISPMAFTFEWDRGAPLDEVAGYKVFVGLNPTFSTYLPRYRNVDVGLDTSFTVSLDVTPLTSYWVRVRSYDQANNESWDSATLQIVTSRMPDTEPPDVVQTLPATSVESSRFTANWVEGTDNVGVVGYYLDVAADENFTRIFSAYRNRDVGNVTRFPVTGLQRDQGYYYRVRAYDEAGNTSDNATAGEQVFTKMHTSDLDGIVEIQSIARTFNAGGVTDAPFAQITSVVPMQLGFDTVSALGQITHAELLLRIANVTGTGELQVYQGETMLGSAAITSNAEAVGVQIGGIVNGFNAPTLTLKTTGDLALDVVTMRHPTMPAPAIDFEVNILEVVRPQESRITTEFATARNFLPCPDFQDVNRGTFGFEKSSAVTDVLEVEPNWGVLSRCSTFALGGNISFYSDLIGDSSNKFDPAEPLRGSVFISLRDNNLGLAPTNFLIQVGVQYTDNSESGSTVSLQQVATGYFHFESEPFFADPSKVVRKVFLRIHAPAQFKGSIYTYLPTAYQSSEPLYPFCGSSHNGSWEEEVGFGTSLLTYLTIKGELDYVGDSDNNSSARLALLSREVGLAENKWYATTFATRHTALKMFEATTKHRYIANYLANGSFDVREETNWFPYKSSETVEGIIDYGGAYVDGEPSRQGDRHMTLTLNSLPQPDTWIGIANAQVINGRALTGSVVRYSLKGKAGTVARLDYISAVTGAITTLQEVTLGAEAWQDFSYHLGFGAYDSGYLTIKFNTTNMFQNEKVAIDCVQVASGDQLSFFAGERTDGAFSAGVFGLSSVYGYLPTVGVQDVIWLVDDPDGVEADIRYGSTGVIGESVNIVDVPDNILSVDSLECNPSDRSLEIILKYHGDDNATATGLFVWKRSDLAETSAWNNAPIIWDRRNKIARVVIGNLHPSTSYTVEMRLQDGSLPIYGENPIRRTFLTTQSVGTVSEPTRIMFGGFALMDSAARDRWVSEHNAFDHPSRDVAIDKLPRNHGGVELSDWWGTRVIRMSGGISANNRAELAAKLRDMQRALAPRQQRLVIDTLDSRSYYFNATCTEFKAPEVAGQTIRHLQWTATFECADPFRHSSEMQVDKDIVLSHNESMVVINDGDIAVEPTIEITTKSPTPLRMTLLNTSTGERITPFPTIKAGDRLLIQCEHLRLLKNGVDVEYSGSFPSVDVGENEFTVQLAPATYPIVATVRRRHKYF